MSAALESAPVAWEDVTMLCREVASQLSDEKPIVHVENFSMYDAMGAVEMLDSKMDQRCGLLGPLAVDDILRSSMPASLDVERLVAVMEKLLVCELSYLNGASLQETIKQCCFMWPEVWCRLEDSYGPLGAILTAHCRSLARSVGSAHTFIMAADVYEEGDIHMGSRPYEVDLSDAMEKLILAIESARVLAAEHPLFSQLQALLTLRLELHRFFEDADKILGQAVAVTQRSAAATSEQMDVGAKRADRDSRVMQSCRTMFSNCQNVLASLRNVKELCGAATDSFDIESSTASAYGFNANIGRVLSTSPARVVVVPSVSEATAQLECICGQVALIAKVIPGFCLSNTAVDKRQNASFDSLISWCSSVSKSRFHLISRSLQWGFLHSLCALGGIDDMLKLSMKESWIPDAYIEYPLCSEWVSSLSSVAWESLKGLCVYRYHILSMFDRLIAHWNRASETATRLDAALRAHLYPQGMIIPESTDYIWASKWCMRIMGSLMEVHLLLFVELDLMSGFELGSYYWFCEYICSTRVWAIRKLREMRAVYDRAIYDFRLQEADEIIKEHKRKKSSSKSSGGGKELKEAKRALSAPPPVVPSAPSEEHMLVYMITFYKGMIRTAIQLEKLGYIREDPVSEFSSASFRFVNRYNVYESLHHIAPARLEDYQKAVHIMNENEPSTPEMLKAASQFLTSAKTSFDSYRKNELGSVTLINWSSKPDEYAIIYYDRLSEANEKCMGLIKAAVASSVFLIRFQQSLQAEAQGEATDRGTKFKKLTAPTYTREGIPEFKFVNP